jgi:anti-anti-sigma factor
MEAVMHNGDERTIVDVYPIETGGSVGVSRQDGVVILHLAGEFDIYAARVLRGQCRLVLEAGCPCIVDVREVSFVDSAALGALLEAKHRSERLRLPFLLVLPEGRHAVARAMSSAGLRFEHRTELPDAIRAAGTQRLPDRHAKGR